MKEIYVSTDVEADGKIPGVHSMLSLGSAVFSDEGELLDTFSVNLETLPGATTHPDVMQWWAKHPDAWAASRIDAKPPHEAMDMYRRWLKALPGRPVFVAHPAAYDFMWVYWYLICFGDESPFGFSALDMKTLAMEKLKLPFRKASKRNMPAEWKEELPTRHTHIAVEDAVEQGMIFYRMRAS